MSFNRENVTWQSKDGTWNIGFFAVAWFGSEADGYDPEWDVEYDVDRFEYVSRGHKSSDDAFHAYTRYHANPGGTTVNPYHSDPETLRWITKYEAMADELTASQKSRY